MDSRSSKADRTETTSRVNRARRLVRTAGLGLSAAALACVFAFPSAPAFADPALTIAEAKAQIEQLETDAAAIDQDYAGVQQKLSESKSTLALKQSDKKVQAEKVARLKAQVGQVALAQFQNRNLDTAAQLFVNADTEDFLSQISTVEKVSENQNSVLQNFQEEQADLAELEHSSKTDLAALTTQEKELQRLRDASAKKVSEAKTILEKLTKEQQDQIAAEQAKVTEDATAAVEAGPDISADASDRGAKALAFAKSQLGKPYRFGAVGPGSYDCSGLTLAAWKAAGVSLSRTSQTQFHDGTAVDRADLQPGDLVFYYPGSISHVAMYVGNGMIIHAPRPGTVVRYAPVGSMAYAGARRPG